MPRYFLHFSYDGSHYRGWQTQAQVRSIQETMTVAMTSLLHTYTPLQGCGRTDAGVHASQYFAHFNTEHVLDIDLVFILNKMLPTDIRIYHCIAVADDHNAQLSPTSRTYTYLTVGREDPFLRDRAWFLPSATDLDLDSMQVALSTYRATTDFRAMCKRPDKYPHTRCKIYNATIEVDEGRLIFVIEADRFLMAMIRLTVHRLVDVGAGHLTTDEFAWHLSTGTPFNPMIAAPPQGLYLSKVTYPFLDISTPISIR